MPIRTPSRMKPVVSITALVAILGLAGMAPATAQDPSHAHHQMTDEQFAELREKVPLYREFTDEQIMENMGRMGPNFHVYLSDAEMSGNIGVLALGHGYEPDSPLFSPRSGRGLQRPFPLDLPAETGRW